MDYLEPDVKFSKSSFREDVMPHYTCTSVSIKKTRSSVLQSVTWAIATEWSKLNKAIESLYELNEMVIMETIEIPICIHSLKVDWFTKMPQQDHHDVQQITRYHVQVEDDENQTNIQ